ncbi:MAG: iron-containing alcohol dehydrogenase [Spirochaetota bacterium]
MTSFSVLSPAKLEYGPGSVNNIPGIVAELKSEASPLALVLSDKGVSGTGLPARIASAVEKAGTSCLLVDSVPPEPTDGDLDGIATILRQKKVGIIIAIGGGSVMDASKILSVLTTNTLKTANLAEQGVKARGIPYIAVPTTAGTGAEATPNAIIMFPDRNLKIGIVSPHFIPDRVLLDPELTLGLPRGLTASTGMDALCHLLECHIGKKANPYSNLFAREGMGLVAANLREACNNGSNLEARSAMMLAAYYGGVCIASSGTNAVHALSYPLGGTFRIPHGIANAALLVPVLASLAERIPQSLGAISRIMGFSSSSKDEEATETLIAGLHTLVADLGIPRTLDGLGVPASAIPELTEAAYSVRRLLDNNPVGLSKEDIRGIYKSMTI